MSGGNGVARGFEWLLLLLNLIISYRIIIVEPGGPRRPFFFLFSPREFHTFQKKYRFGTSKTISSQTLPFVVVVPVQGFSSKVDMPFFAFLQFLFSHNDSRKKWRRQASWTTVVRRHFLHSRTRILLKSRDDRGARRSSL